MDTTNTPSDAFRDFIKEAALLTIPELRPDEIYTAEQICVATWDQLDKSEHIRAGLAISSLAATGQLPLVAYQKTPTNLSRYTLR